MSNRKRSMVVGASGLVGSWLMSELGDRAVGTSYSQQIEGYQPLDIRDSRAVAELLEQFAPEVVYCPAARPAVDWCEENSQESYEINVRGIENVARTVKQVGAKIVFFSSDYVFDGRDGPYSETDEPHPICVYGEQKLEAERLVADLLGELHIIARTTVVYGWERAGKNFVFRLVRSLREGKALRVPVDQVGSPTYAPSLAEAVVELAEGGFSGTWNVCGPKCMDRYEFSLLAAEVFGLDGSLIQPVSTSQLRQVAARPLRAGVKVDKARAVLKSELVRPRAGLEDMRDSEASFKT